MMTKMTNAMIRAMHHVILLLICLCHLVSCLSVGPSQPRQLAASSWNDENTVGATKSRRAFVSSLMVSTPVMAVASSVHAVVALDPRSTVTLRLNSPSEKAGLKLGEVTIGTPPRTAVAVEQVLPGGLAERARVQPGVIVLDYDNAKAVTERIRNGPYPIDLKFYNLAAGGDAFGDMGKPLVTAQDALDMAKSTSSSVETLSSVKASDQEYVIRVLKQPPASCQIQSRRGDVLEINYEARYGKADGPIYDSSFQRGTGQPYQFVLGSGDMIPGVDRGMYEMCPGEQRLLEIPPSLGYGPRASNLYGIPSPSRLYWAVELVSMNSVREGDDRNRDELEGRMR